MPQTFNDDELGAVVFSDSKEQVHSAKCRQSDIKLHDKFDAPTARRLRAAIADDINRIKESGNEHTLHQTRKTSVPDKTGW